MFDRSCVSQLGMKGISCKHFSLRRAPHAGTNRKSTGCVRTLDRNLLRSIQTHTPTPHHHHNTTQLNTTQHNTTQHNTTQHNTTQHNTTPPPHHTTPHHNTAQQPHQPPPPTLSPFLFLSSPLSQIFKHTRENNRLPFDRKHIYMMIG